MPRSHSLASWPITRWIPGSPRTTTVTDDPRASQSTSTRNWGGDAEAGAASTPPIAADAITTATSRLMRVLNNGTSLYSTTPHESRAPSLSHHGGARNWSRTARVSCRARPDRRQMPGNVADRWQSRQSGIVFWILLSVVMELTWWTSSGTSERPQSLQLHRTRRTPAPAACRARLSTSSTGLVLAAVRAVDQGAAGEAGTLHGLQIAEESSRCRPILEPVHRHRQGDHSVDLVGPVRLVDPPSSPSVTRDCSCDVGVQLRVVTVYEPPLDHRVVQPLRGRDHPGVVLREGSRP